MRASWIAALAAVFMLPAHVEARGWAYFRAHVKPSHHCGAAREVAASYYDARQGSATSSGAGYNRYAMRAAAPRYDGWPAGARLRLRNPRNGRVVEITINDTLPMGEAYHSGVRLDLTPAAHRALGMTATEWICVSRVADIENDPIPMPRPRPANAPIAVTASLIGAAVWTPLKLAAAAVTITSDVLRNRPFRLKGQINIAGLRFPFDSGGMRGHPSVPYGNYRITHNVGNWGARHAALGLGNDDCIWDPKIRRCREGIELHAAGGSMTEGCIGIHGWPKARRAILAMIARFGSAFLHVWPGNVSVTPTAKTTYIAASMLSGGGEKVRQIGHSRGARRRINHAHHRFAKAHKHRYIRARPKSRFAGWRRKPTCSTCIMAMIGRKFPTSPH